MAKYVVNKNYNNEITVEGAAKYTLDDGYFNFVDAAGHKVRTLRAAHVETIELVEDK